jgi:hypothetical protein
MIKSRRMRWVDHVALIGGKSGKRKGYYWESQRERDHISKNNLRK